MTEPKPPGIVALLAEPVTSYRITARGRGALEGYRLAMLQGLSRRKA